MIQFGINDRGKDILRTCMGKKTDYHVIFLVAGMPFFLGIN